MKIAILSQKASLYSTRRLMEAGQQRGHEVHVVNYLRCYMNITSHKPMVIYQGKPLEGFFVRKQAKEHGAKERVEGVLKSGMRVAVLDDVLTTGGSVVQAIGEIEKVGAIVVAVVCIVDRMEGAREALAKYPFLPIFTIRDFGIER